MVTEDGLMRPALAAKKGGLFCGGSARMVEKALGVGGWVAGIIIGLCTQLR